MLKNNGKKIKIAIDGPAASGKSTTAKLVAQKLGYLYIDTGAMYRALTLKAIEEKIDLTNHKEVTELAKKSLIELKNENGIYKVYLDNKDVTQEIRSPRVTQLVSLVSSYKDVRDIMVESQKRMASNGGVVLEGRDIGTVVLPDAELKVFMVASVEERVKRRKKELEQNGVVLDEQELIKEIQARDYKDSTREASPLKKAEDAIELDTSNLTIEEQVNFIVERALKIINQK